MALLPVDDALAQLLAAADKRVAEHPLQVESVLLLDALGRILAHDVIAPINVPPERNSAMDGYAFCHRDLQTASSLRVSQRIPAGHAPQPLQTGTAARIFTGGVLPEGADTVEMQENCREGDGQVQFLQPIRIGANVRAAGEDIPAGSTVLPAGTRLGAVHLGLLASLGMAEVVVRERLRVALLCSGDELVAPGGKLASGQLFNSNQTLLTAFLQQQGCEVVVMDSVADSLEATRAGLRAAIAQHVHLLLSTGGVSVGEEDHLRAAVEAEGRLDLWKVAIKPGKPLAFGQIQGVPYLGLPGNPQSAWVTAQVLALPFMRRLQGDATQPVWLQLPAGFERVQAQGRREYLRARISVTGDGSLRLEAHGRQGSGVLSSAVWADGLALIEAGDCVTQGQLLPFMLVPK